MIAMSCRRSRTPSSSCCWPPRQRAGHAAGGLGEAEPLEQLARPAPRLAPRDAREQGRQLDVVGHRQVVDQVEEREDEAELAAPQPRPAALAGVVDALAVQVDLARRRAVEPAQQVQQRRRAAAARPRHGQELAVRELEVDPVQRHHLGLAAAVHHAQPAHVEHRRHEPSTSSQRSSRFRSASRCSAAPSSTSASVPTDPPPASTRSSSPSERR
jgi:hypothetical protein